jgi:hypothetical protein
MNTFVSLEAANPCIPVVNFTVIPFSLWNSLMEMLNARYLEIAGLVRNLFTRSIDLGRSYARSGNKAELYEALRLMGTGLHCLEGIGSKGDIYEV